jgi:hypothetical protein
LRTEKVTGTLEKLNGTVIGRILLKKYKIVLPSILMLLFVGCNTVEKQPANSIPTTKNVDISTTSKGTDSYNSQIIINEKSMEKTSTFTFDMSKEEVVTKLDKMKVKIINEIEITTSKDDPQWGNKQLWTEGLSFSFDKNNRLYDINIHGDLATSLGLKNGDSVEKIEELYGTDYRKNKTNTGFVYEYVIDKYYFRVLFETEEVTGWGISKYKF